MRIVFGSYQAITILEGGVKTQVFALKKELEKLGIEVLLFDSWQQYKDIDAVHLFCAHLGTYHLAKSIQALNIKLIMTPVFYSKRSINFIRSVLSLSKFLSKFGVVYPYLVAHELCTMANIVAPNTQKECELITKGLTIDHSKIKLLPNGVDERFYYAEPSLFINKYGMKDFILYVGHIGWQRKNLLRLLKICQQFDVPMVLIGKIINNEYGKRCLEFIRSRKNTLLITDIEHSDPILSSAYAACDTLVLPSYYETPGLVALEAGLAGAKIVITKYGGTDEYFKGYVQYLEPRSSNSIKQAIEKSLSQKKNSELKEHIKNNYLWSHAAEKLVKIYETMK